MFVPDWQPGETPPEGLEMSTAPKVEKVRITPLVLPAHTSVVMSPAVGA